MTDKTGETEQPFEQVITEARRLLENLEEARALPIIHKAILLDTSRPEGFNLLGALAELRGDWDAARRMYRVALTIDATYSPASFNLDRLCQWRSVGRTSQINFGDVLKKELSLRDVIVK